MLMKIIPEYKSFWLVHIIAKQGPLNDPILNEELIYRFIWNYKKILLVNFYFVRVTVTLWRDRRCYEIQRLLSCETAHFTPQVRSDIEVGRCRRRSGPGATRNQTSWIFICMTKRVINIRCRIRNRRPLCCRWNGHLHLGGGPVV